MEGKNCLLKYTLEAFVVSTHMLDFLLVFYSIMDCKQFLKEPFVRIHCWKRFHTFTIRSICFSSWLKNRSLRFIISLSSFCIKGKRSASTCQFTIIYYKQTTHSRKFRLGYSLLCLSVFCWHMQWYEGEKTFLCSLMNVLFFKLFFYLF